MEVASRIPLVILAGSDRSSKRPDRAGNEDLVGFKAVDTKLDGKPLIQVAVERFRAAGLFDPIVIAGPSTIYEPLDLGARLVDTDGSFGQNIAAATEVLVEELGSDQVAITTADIVPESSDLQRAMDDYLGHSPIDWWMAVHRVEDPEQLQSSAYKPRYRFIPHGETEPVATLPGHLLIANPLAGRRELIYKVFNLAYESRGRSVAFRRIFIMRGAITTLLAEDLRRLTRFQLPKITFTLVWQGLRLATSLRKGDVDIDEIEDILRKMWATGRHRKRYPDRRGRFAVFSCRSLARDVDTVEEARELAQKGAL